MNYYDLLASKYGGGSEILKEVYKLSDQGERELALRYDLTIPVVKVIGMNSAMRLPFRRYEIGKVFRDGPIKAISEAIKEVIKPEPNCSKGRSCCGECRKG